MLYVYSECKRSFSLRLFSSFDLCVILANMSLAYHREDLSGLFEGNISDSVIVRKEKFDFLNLIHFH